MSHFFMTPSPESLRIPVAVSTDEDASLNNEFSASNKEGQRLFCDDQENRNVENATPSLSDSEVKRRELEESERLAWQLMQEESMSAYQMQLDYLKNNMNGMDEEEMRAIEGILRESEMVEGVPASANDESFADEEEEEEHSSANWSYEQLLALGEAIGDVKTEKWRLRSSNVIDALPTCTYSDILSGAVTARRCDVKCNVCMEEYATDSELKILPCEHCFHAECSVGWLKDHNSCPECKVKVTQSPN